MEQETAFKEKTRLHGWGALPFMIKKSLIIFVTSFCFFSSTVLSQAQTYPIGPGDILQVSIYAGGEKQEDFTVEVSPGGTMTSPLIGELKVGG